MPDERDLPSVLSEAERAAAASDYASAEKLLREAAALQEATLGPLHPDLANTLNNLAVVCEITDKPADAERYYRRAAAIATSALDADHPFVATSRKNLEDFCAARGLSVGPPPSRPAPAPPPAPAPKREPQAALPPPAPRTVSRPLVIGAVVVGGLAVVMLMATRPWSPDTTAAAGEAVAAPASAPPVTPTPAPKTPAAKKTGPAPPVVVNARLCRTLITGSVDWSCEGPTSPIGAGPIYFYTRLRSPRDVTVQHRWYRGDQLQQEVDLQISANLGRGYRTYSRSVLDSGSAGEWKVELRTKDGVLLHQETFAVR